MVVLTTNCHKNTLSKCDLPTNNTSQPGGVKSLVKRGYKAERQSHRKSRKIKNQKKSQNQKFKEIAKPYNYFIERNKYNRCNRFNIDLATYDDYGQ